MVEKEGALNSAMSSDLVWIVPVAALGFMLALVVLVLCAYPVLIYILGRFSSMDEGRSEDLTQKEEEDPSRVLAPYVLPEPSPSPEPFAADARLGLAFLGLEDMRVDIVAYPEWNEWRLRRDGLCEPESKSPFRFEKVSLAAFVRRPSRILETACHVPYLEESIRAQIIADGCIVATFVAPTSPRKSSLKLCGTLPDEVRIKWFLFSRLDPGDVAALDIRRMLELCGQAREIAAMTTNPDERRDVRHHLFRALGRVGGYDFSTVDYPDEGRAFRSMLIDLCGYMIPSNS